MAGLYIFAKKCQIKQWLLKGFLYLKCGLVRCIIYSVVLKHKIDTAAFFYSVIVAKNYTIVKSRTAGFGGRSDAR
jgi:hypothetical protein